jgi:hypothetical protein
VQVNSSGFRMVSYKKTTTTAASALILLNTGIHYVLEYGTLASIPIISKTERSKTLSVSHFSLQVTTNDMEKSQKRQLSLNKLIYTRLTTKFNTYLSFHVLDLEDEYTLINPYTAALEMSRARKAVPCLLHSRYFEYNFRARMNYVRVYSRHSNFAGSKSHLLGM